MRRTALALIALTTFAFACSEEANSPHEHGQPVQLAAGELVDARFEQHEPFKQLGFFYDSADAEILYRVEGSNWKPIDVTWSEDNRHVGRVMLDAPAKVVELKSAKPLTSGFVQFYPEHVGSQVLTKDLPKVEANPVLNGLAPASLVISRAEWGARNPNKVCYSPHTPYRMAIHHTASPDSDGGDPAARMRQMQAYHIDTNGWCDIGYHFVVSQSGKIYQGQSSEERLGTHVGGQNTGNIGVCLIGNFQTQTPSQTQLSAAADIVRWIGNTYNIEFNRTNIKGHREHAGASTACPGDNLLSQLDTIIAMASNGEIPDVPTDEYDVAFDVSWLTPTEDVYQDGTSLDVPDVFAGDVVEAEIRITNNSTRPLRGILLSYLFDTKYLEPVEYRIETDAPEFDKTTFVLNDANDAPENPVLLTGEGDLVMYAMAAGETKRVVVKFNVLRPSIGPNGHPAARAWVRNIDDVYGIQTDFGADPTNMNVIGQPLQGLVELDVLSRDMWEFNGTDSFETEGWIACSDDTNALTIEGGAMVTSGGNACIESPIWTQVNAAEYDQMVLKLAEPALQERASLYFASEGSDVFTGGIGFALRGDLMVIPVGNDTRWVGSIDGLRLIFEGAGTAKIDAIFFQKSDGTTSNDEQDFVDQEPEDVEMLDPTRDPGVRIDDQPKAADITVSEGCSSTPVDSGANGYWLLAIGLLGLVRRRRA